MTEPTVLLLADRNDAHHFVIGAPIAMSINAHGQLVPSTRCQRLAAWLGRRWRRLTWWRQTRTVVVDVDRQLGSITVGTARWSWRQWKWVVS